MVKQGYARQAIVTKFLGPTNHRGSRVKATSESGHMLIVSWDDRLDVFQNHQAAALALTARLGWGDAWIGGGIKTGYAWVDAGSVR